MIVLDKPLQSMDGGPALTSCAVRNLQIDTKDRQIYALMGFGHHNDVQSHHFFAAGIPVRRFSFKGDAFYQGARKYELTPGFYDNVMCGAAGSVVKAIENALVDAGVFAGKVR